MAAYKLAVGVQIGIVGGVCHGLRVQSLIKSIQAPPTVRSKKNPHILNTCHPDCVNLKSSITEKSFILKDNVTYRSDLLQQMEFQKCLKEFESAQTQRDLELRRDAETLHQRRVSEALARPHPDKVHPKRLRIAGQGLP